MFYKKFYLKLLMGLLLMAFMAPPAAQAETVTVCPGTTSNAYVPLYGGQISSNSSQITSQMIYPAAKLSDVGISEGSIIKSITFSAYGSYTINKSNITSKTMVVKVGEVSNASVTATTLQNQSLIANATEVYNGTATFSSDGKQMTFTFSGDGYTWNGGDFAVQIYIEASGGNATDTYWAVQNATSGASGSRTYSIRNGRWNSAQIQSVLPQMEVTYETAEVKEYDAKVSPTSLAFGKMTPGEEATLNITVQNKGTNAITPSISGLSSPFSTTYTASSLASGETATIPVKFNPTIAGDWNETATISFGTTELDDVQVTLSGSAAYELTICDGTGTSSNLPVYGLYYDEYAQTNQMIYPAEKLSSMKGKRLKSMTFYSSSTRFFSNGTVTFSLANVDAGTTFTTAARITPNDLTQVYSATPTVAQEWTINFDENANFVYNGGDLLVDVVTTTGDYNSVTFLGESGHNNASWYTSSSNGSGTIQNFLPMVTFTFENSETPTPVISGTVTPTTLNFGTVTVGENGTATITVENTGNTAFTPVFSTLEAPFSIEAATEIAADESKTYTVTYQPTTAGENEGSFNVTIGEQDPITVTLTGTATAPAVDYAVTMSDNSGAHNYGNVLVNSSNVWTLTITNNGTQAVTPTLSGIEAPFSTTYTATALAAGESATISINYAPTELGEHSNTITVSFPEAGDAIAAYTCELTGKAVDESYDPSAENEVVKLVTVDQRSIYEPNFIDNANGNTTPQQLNCYDMRFKMAQPDDPAKRIKAGDLRPGNNLFEFYAIDDFGTEFRFATINLFAEGQPSSNPSVNAMDAPIKVTPSVEYYTEDGMPVHSNHTHNTTLNYTEKTYNDINELVDLEGVIDYVNDTWSANTATNAHPDHYKFQIRGVGQYGDVLTSLTAEYVESHMTGYGNQLVMPEGWDRGTWAGPNNEASDDVHTFYYYDLYIKKSFFDERGITGPVTVVVNTTLSGSGFNADNYKAMNVNGVEQIIAKEQFKDYSWTVPLLDSIPAISTVEQVPMGVIIRLVSTGADFNRTTGIYIYGGGTGVSNIDTVNIYKSSMNVKAYTQKQVDEDTDRGLVAMNAGAQSDVNVLAYGDPAVTGYVLNKNTSASTTGMTQVASANHEANGKYTVNSVGTYNGTYDFVRDESLGNIDGMWLPMYPAAENEYYLPVTWANGVGDDGEVRSENNTYGSAMQQVQKNGSVDFDTYTCYRSDYTWSWENDDVTYAIYNPYVKLSSELPAATGYQLYNYRLWVDYDENAPAWDFEVGQEDGKIHLTTKMDRPLYSGTNSQIGGKGTLGRKDNWAFVAPADLEEVKLIARFYYKKNSTSSLKARPTDSDRLYYVVEKQVTLKTGENIITGIEDVTNKTVAGVKYYNLMGVESNEPFNGVNIVVTRYTDGSISTSKVLK